MKRFVSLILCACFVLGMGIIPVSAENAVSEQAEFVEIIDAQYDDTLGFTDGYAAVEVNGLWGYIDETGKTVIEPKYLSAGSMNDGYAVVSKMGMTSEYDYELDDVISYEAEVLYIIDTEGNETPVISYDLGVAAWGPKVEGQVSGKATDLMIYGGVLVFNEMAYGLDGKVIEPKLSDAEDEMLREYYNYYEVTGPCVDGIIPVRASYIPTDAAYICFLMDKSGNIIREFPHAEVFEEEGILAIYSYKDGLTVVLFQESDFVSWDTPYTTNYYIGVLDEENNWIIEPKITNYRYYLSGAYFSDDLWVVSTDSGYNWGAFNTKGELAIPYSYDFLSSFSGGFASARIDSEWFFVDKENNTYVIPSYDGGTAKIEGATPFNSNGIAAVYDAISGTAYLVRKPAEDGAPVTVIKNSNNLLASDFFFNYDVENAVYRGISGVQEIMTYKADGKYGFKRLVIEEMDPDEALLNGTPSTWAKAEIIAALKEGLVPEHINGNYTNEITRSEFCDLIIRMIEMKSGNSIDEVIAGYAEARAEVEFTDTDNPNVIAAYRLGIVNGRSTTAYIFDPGASITRQEAAKMLACTAVVLGADISVDEVEFADSADIHGWAAEYVYYVNTIGVMNGTSTATPPTFTPLGTYTREQSILTVYRLFNAL